METTRLSSKGQIIIPQKIREAHHWNVGLEFAVIDTDKGLLLTPLKPFQKTNIKELIGCTNYKGKKKSLAEMKAGIKKGAKERK
jgi:AbrB family looped-hinge helix DNA binding protein